MNPPPIIVLNPPPIIVLKPPPIIVLGASTIHQKEAQLETASTTQLVKKLNLFLKKYRTKIQERIVENSRVLKGLDANIDLAEYANIDLKYANIDQQKHSSLDKQGLDLDSFDDFTSVPPDSCPLVAADPIDNVPNNQEDQDEEQVQEEQVQEEQDEEDTDMILETDLEESEYDRGLGDDIDFL